jgi:hypothetical protein
MLTNSGWRTTSSSSLMKRPGQSTVRLTGGSRSRARCLATYLVFGLASGQ